MIKRVAVALGWGILASCVINVFVASSLFGESGVPLASTLMLLLVFLAFPLVGAFIVSQRPTNTVGWLLLAVGVGTVITSFSAAYVQHALLINADTQLATRYIDLAGDLMWPINIFLGIMLLFLFPDGRPLSPRWRLATWAFFLDLALMTLAQAVMPGPLETRNRVWNPLGIPGLKDLSTFVINYGQGLLFLFLPLAVISLILRYRRASDAGRQQIKWFVFGSAIMVIVAAGGGLAASLISSDPNDPLASGIGNATFAVGILALPLGVGVGALRYRLYDIDVIINRTLVYGLLTAILGALYVSLVIGLGDLLRFFSEQASQNSFVIVLSTLLIAALFQPLRHRIQATIDRRFYRHKYDAARTLAAFGATLRQEVELDDLSASLLDVVEETMRPARVSLWLRPALEQSVSTSASPSSRAGAQ
ncbi:MAG TPA: hypothetical protein VFQ25_10475 [Ktedonobacterales bacterium]|nr:hypothetical protein [Ktedonobacterales bacterium]